MSDTVSATIAPATPTSVQHSAHVHHVAHQFDTAEQQKEAVTLGMWLFLAQEVMFFGGLFLGYSIYRSAYHQAFAGASHHLDVWMGGINTVVLLTSSLTMALAVRSAQTDDRRGQIRFLIATIALGLVFLVIKGFEYHAKFVDHLVPGPDFASNEPHHKPWQIFFSFYFAMTGMHALHMIIGFGLMSVILWMAYKGRFSSSYYSPIENAGLYWHFVDIVWIFLFPLLYLIR